MIIEIRTIIDIPNQVAGRDYDEAIENITDAILQEFPDWQPAENYTPVRVTIKGLEIQVKSSKEWD